MPPLSEGMRAAYRKPEINHVKFFVRASALLSMLLLSGCSEVWCWPFDCTSSKSSSGVVDDSGQSAATMGGTAPVTPGSSAEFDLGKVTWLHTNVSSWPVTHKLTVELGGGVICLNHGGSTAWPSVQIDHTSGAYKIDVNANPWVFAYRNGQWYGGTWEWMAPGNTCKPSRSVAGDHVKQPGLVDWNPTSGETVYLMVSSLARFPNITNIQARTDAVKVIWP
jgi:hypothetical protein